METTALASAFVGAQQGQQQVALQAKMLRMNADAAASVVKMIEASLQNLDRLANVSPGVGASVDISV
jgi:hypothetical protein